MAGTRYTIGVDFGALSGRAVVVRVGDGAELYAQYTALHDYFGRGTNPVMRRLKKIRRAVLTEAPPRETATAEAIEREEDR